MYIPDSNIFWQKSKPLQGKYVLVPFFHLFTAKDTRFKGEPFLREIKEVYTELINRHIADSEQHLKVFDKNSVYLPTKKIGKNNPKEDEIKADNAARREWNRTADMALLSGISEAKILEVKRTEKEISEKLDKLPDVLREDGYPDVQAFMATYRKAEAVVEQYNRDLAAWERQVRKKQKPAQSLKNISPQILFFITQK